MPFSSTEQTRLGTLIKFCQYLFSSLSVSGGEGAVKKKLEREAREEGELLFRKDIRVSR